MTANRYHALDSLVAAIVNALLIDMELITASEKDLVVTAIMCESASENLKLVRIKPKTLKMFNIVDMMGK